MELILSIYFMIYVKHLESGYRDIMLELLEVGHETYHSLIDINGYVFEQSADYRAMPKLIFIHENDKCTF